MVTGVAFVSTMTARLPTSRESADRGIMAADNLDNLLTAGAIAKALGASDAKVKKAITDLGIAPAAKKGVCAYYGKDVLPKVKAAVAKS